MSFWQFLRKIQEKLYRHGPVNTKALKNENLKNPDSPSDEYLCRHASKFSKEKHPRFVPGRIEGLFY
jgi:hypothetical protein